MFANILTYVIFVYGMAGSHGYKLVRQFLLSVESVCHNWLQLRLSAIPCFLARLLSAKNGFLLSLFV